MSVNRTILLKELHLSYKRHDSLKDVYCFYCGSLADSRDHCPSLFNARCYPDEERILFRCCYLCNSLLSNKFLLRPLPRLEFLKTKYKKRWKKDIDLPDWTDEEIDQLQGELKREVIKARKRKKRALDVLTNIEKKLEIYLEEI